MSSSSSLRRPSRRAISERQSDRQIYPSISAASSLPCCSFSLLNYLLIIARSGQLLRFLRIHTYVRTITCIIALATGCVCGLDRYISSGHHRTRERQRASERGETETEKRSSTNSNKLLAAQSATNRTRRLIFVSISLVRILSDRQTLSTTERRSAAMKNKRESSSGRECVMG